MHVKFSKKKIKIHLDTGNIYKGNNKLGREH